MIICRCDTKKPNKTVDGKCVDWKLAESSINNKTVTEQEVEKIKQDKCCIHCKHFSIEDTKVKETREK